MSPPAWTASVLGRARSPMAWFQLVAGLWDVLHDGIRHVTPLSFGVATILVGVVLLVAGALAGVRPGPGTLVNMVLIGIFSDAMLAAGIGTILFAFGIGPAVEVAFRLLRVEVPSKKTAPRVQPCETC